MIAALGPARAVALSLRACGPCRRTWRFCYGPGRTVSGARRPVAGSVLALLARSGPGGDRHATTGPVCCGVSGLPNGLCPGRNFHRQVTAQVACSGWPCLLWTGRDERLLAPRQAGSVAGRLSGPVSGWDWSGSSEPSATLAAESGVAHVLEDVGLGGGTSGLSGGVLGLHMAGRRPAAPPAIWRPGRLAGLVPRVVGGQPWLLEQPPARAAG